MINGLILTVEFSKGAYRDDNGKPVVLECVRDAERRIAGNLNMYVCYIIIMVADVVFLFLFFFF